MPNPSDYSDEESFMEACVPTMIDEGKPQDQAVAACLQMWRDKAVASDWYDLKAPEPITRAWSTLTVKSIDAEQRTIEGIASTPTVDRVGDIVEPLGAKFTLPIPLLHHHKNDQPVGQVIAAKATKAGIEIKAQLARVVEPGALKDRVDLAWQEIKAGLVRGLSIGFKPLKDGFEPIDPNDPFGGLRFNAWNWFELSLVTIPANADANITLIKSLDQGLQAASGKTETAVATRPGASGTKTSVNLQNPEYRKMSKTYAEQIGDYEATRAAKAARMAALMSKASEEGVTLDREQEDEYDELERDVDQIDKHLARLAKLEKTCIETAKPVVAKTVEEGSLSRGNGHAAYVRVSSPDAPKGVTFARVVRCLGLAQGNRSQAADIAEKRYGDDQRVVGTLKAAAYYGEVSDLAIKAAVNAATTGENQWAGVLVSAASGESGAVGDFLEFLRPQTVLGKFGTNGIPALRRVPFRTGLVTQASGGAAYWVPEAGAKPLTRIDFARTTLLPTKLASIAVATDELLRDSSPSADVLIRDTLAAALRDRLDRDFIDPTSTASGAKPASITAGAVQVMSAGAGGAGTGTAAQVRNDVRAMIGQFIANNNTLSNAVWIMSSTTAMNLSMMVNALGEPEDFARGLTMTGGTFMNLPVIVSEYVPSSGSPVGHFVILMDANSVWFADDGGLRVDMSSEASLQMDDAATMTASGTGSSPAAPTATSVVSMWQTNCVAFRAEMTVNWLVARSHGVSVLTGGNWGE